MKNYMTTSFAFLALLVGLMAGCSRRSDSSSVGGTADYQSQSTGRATNAADVTASSEDASAPVNTTPLQPDNTGVNTRDRSDATLTPGDQGGSDSDREITRRVRRALTANDQLSITAKNTKIITIDGKVTLRGPVKDDQEKKLVESLVRQAGVPSFKDRLEVKTITQ